VRYPATLYLHFPCFDGLISAVLASELLEQQGWSFERFRPVNYDVRGSWASERLDSRSALVDFLYHPDTLFWADHHSTTFLSDELRADYERRRNTFLLYDSASSSCALLLWRNFSASFGSESGRYREMVEWADKIDSARYTDVREAILGDAPALAIHRSLLIRADGEYCDLLIRALRKNSLEDVAQLQEVRDRAKESRGLTEAGLARLRSSIHLEDGGIVFFSVKTGRNELVSRYAPFYFFPQARYSVGLVRSDEGAKITAMRNPWVEFDSVPLGRMFEQYGGGGHLRVGSAMFTGGGAGEAERIAREIVTEIQKQDAALLEPFRRALA
jgi:hypothetical protein